MFSLSLVSNLVVSLYKYNKDFVTILVEEEQEKEENEEFNTDKYCFNSHRLSSVISLPAGKQYGILSLPIYNSCSYKPETPPPDFC